MFGHLDIKKQTLCLTVLVHFFPYKFKLMTLYSVPVTGGNIKKQSQMQGKMAIIQQWWICQKYHLALLLNCALLHKKKSEHDFKLFSCYSCKHNICQTEGHSVYSRWPFSNIMVTRRNGGKHRQVYPTDLYELPQFCGDVWKVGIRAKSPHYWC